MCPRSHLGTLSNIQCLPVPDLWVYGGGQGAAPRCNASDGRGGQVWGSKWQGAEMPAPQQLREQVSACHEC